MLSSAEKISKVQNSCHWQNLFGVLVLFNVEEFVFPICRRDIKNDQEIQVSRTARAIFWTGVQRHHLRNHLLPDTTVLISKRALNTNSTIKNGCLFVWGIQLNSYITPPQPQQRPRNTQTPSMLSTGTWSRLNCRAVIRSSVVFTSASGGSDLSSAHGVPQDVPTCGVGGHLKIKTTIQDDD